MSRVHRRTPEVLVLPGAPGEAADARAALAASLDEDVAAHALGPATVLSWGAPIANAEAPIPLSLGGRLDDADADPSSLLRMSRASAPELASALPPFAAFVPGAHSGDAALVADSLGFRALYHTTGGAAPAASTSARALALVGAGAIDETAIATQSMLGWQLGLRTPFADIAKLAPGALCRVDLQGVRLEVRAGGGAGEARQVRGGSADEDLDKAVRVSSGILREYMTSFLEQHPDARLQLTGGHDSRILLAAIPPSLRSRVEAFTLEVPGSEDARIAAELADRHGMSHRIVTLDGLEDLSPADAYAACLQAAQRLEFSADPLAFAAIAWAERDADDRPRLSGLGGEVARGFYYLGPVRTVPVTRRRVDRLARWRLFPNESADAAMWDQAFRRHAADQVLSELMMAFSSTGLDWFRATDEFYLGQRMHRWAGALGTATSGERPVINPMLDHRFLDVVRALSPRHKAGSQFLSRLLIELDPGLARLRMDGRPAPYVYAQGRLSRTRHVATGTARKVARKVRQRVLRLRRPPAGGDILADKVLQHWRAQPDVLMLAGTTGFLDAMWLEAVASGDRSPDALTVAALVNLIGIATTIRQ